MTASQVLDSIQARMEISFPEILNLAFTLFAHDEDYSVEFTPDGCEIYIATEEDPVVILTDSEDKVSKYRESDDYVED